MKAVAAALLLTSSAVSAQPAPPVSFEVASIRQHSGPLSRMADYSASGPRLTLAAYSLQFLLMEAYDLKNHQVGVPSAGALPDF